MAVEVTCQGCGEAFEARRASAKWCSDRCRKSKGRTESTEAPTVVDPVDDEPAELAGLMAAVRRDLVAANALDSFNGQLALQLAKRLTDPDESGISALAKELRSVMALAVGAGALDGDPAARPEAEDEVEKARRKREEARLAAGLA